MSKDRDSRSEEERKGKEHLIKLRDTGDDNEMGKKEYTLSKNHILHLNQVVKV